MRKSRVSVLVMQGNPKPNYEMNGTLQSCNWQLAGLRYSHVNQRAALVENDTNGGG